MNIGLSCKTQEMYLLVFCVRYLDLFMYFISVYNTCMKIFFISATAFTIYLMRFKKPYCTVSIRISTTLISKSRIISYLLRDILWPLINLDLWRFGRWLPTFHGLTASSLRDDSFDKKRLDPLGVHLELQFVAGGSGLHPSDSHAQ